MRSRMDKVYDSRFSKHPRRACGPYPGAVTEFLSPAAHVLVRVWLSDRPGALGLVASRIGSVRGDIIGIDVLERGTDIAVDEFAVQLESSDLIPILVKEIEEVDGASVEEVRVVGSFPDPRLDALDSAIELCEADTADELQRQLVGHVRDEFLADWSALLGDHDLLATAGAHVPDAATLGALVAGGTGPDDLAVAALPRHRATLLVGRSGHPFRGRERAQLLALARIADRSWELLDAGARAGP